MSRLLQIQDQLLDNAAQITRIEREMAQRQSRVLISSLKSLEKVRGGLEAEFKEAAAVAQVDVVSYRLFEGRGRPTMALVGKAMDSFQSLYAIVYSAVFSKRPRDRARLTSVSLQQSSFEFAYAYSGSVGFVFTMPNERLLFGETYLDEAMSELFSMARALTVDEIRSLARKFGLAPIRALYQWADALCTSGTGAELEWRKDEFSKGSLVLQPAQIAALRDLIMFASDLEVDQNTIPGVLLGFDAKTGAFRFDPSDGGTMMRGKIADGADLPPSVTIPKEYSARIRTSTRVRYSTEQPEITHELLALSLKEGS